MRKIILALVAVMALSGFAVRAQAYPYPAFGYYVPYGYRVGYRGVYRPVYRPYAPLYGYGYGYPYGYRYGYVAPYGYVNPGYGPVVYGPRYGYRVWGW